jgi:hypothetical protein
VRQAQEEEVEEEEEEVEEAEGKEMIRRSRVLRPTLTLACALALAGTAMVGSAKAIPPFDPSIEVSPTTTTADTVSGLDFTLHIPQDGLLDPNGIATAHLKKTAVSLPRGMTLSAGAANNLGSCRSDQIGLRSNSIPTCPANSILGTVTVSTPLLDAPLHGSVYLARPFDNPFDNLITIYIVVGPGDVGVIIKLPGEVTMNLQTGEIVTVFDNNPQLPFDRLDLHLDKPSPGSLVTPSCGSYEVEADFWNWARPNEVSARTDEFEITSGSGGGACPAGGDAPSPATAPSLFSGPLRASGLFAKAKARKARARAKAKAKRKALRMQRRQREG